MLLRAAVGLVGVHGFTRNALALSVTQLPPPHTHAAPLSDAAISALFGAGAKAEHSLINFFFDDGIQKMKARAQALSTSEGRPPTIKEMLEERLQFNEPVLEHLSSAFASLASGPSPKLGPFQAPMLDPFPGLKHALRIADEACYLSGDTSTEV
jgi:ubiquinone biosynthesis protein COQ9